MLLALLLPVLLAQDAADLIRRLGDDDVAVREAASQALANMGEACFPALEIARHDSDPEVAARAVQVREAVAENIAIGGPIDPVLSREVFTVLRKSPYRLRSGGPWDFYGHRELPILLTALRDHAGDERILASVLWCLIQSPWEPMDRARLVTILSPILRGRGLDRISDWPPDHVPLWLHLDQLEPLPWTEDDRESIKEGWERMADGATDDRRVELAHALGRAKNDLADALLHRLAEDGNTRIAMFAMLSQRERNSPPTLEQWRGLYERAGPDWAARYRAAEGMAQHGDREGLDFLFQELVSGEHWGAAVDLLLPLLGRPEIDCRCGGGYDPAVEVKRQRGELRGWRRDHAATARWDADKGYWVEK